jgi:RNase H
MKLNIKPKRSIETLKEEMELQVLYDKIPVRQDFEITEREECVKPTTSPGALMYYTDGSRKNGMVGMEIYGPSIRYFETLGSTPTIFQAGMYAINVCARICLTEGGNEGKRIYIMPDSQAALKALEAHTFKSKLVAECLDVLKRLTLKCTVTLRWVSGHIGVEGNEKADQLAIEGSDNYCIGPEPFNNNTKCKLILDEWILRKKKAHFEILPPNLLARRFLSYSSKRTQKLLTLTKSNLKTITRILTGHNGLNYIMHRIGKSLDDNCRLYLEESKTAQHLMCECPAIARIRLKHFDKGYLSPNERKVIKPKKILNFLRAINLEEV